MASAVVSLASIFVFFFASLPLRLYFPQMETSLILMASVVLYTFVKSTVTHNHSQIDEFWSILPLFFCYHLGHWTARGVLMLVLVTLWGTRLSYNFSRKGGYSGGEDYRWEYVRKTIPNPFLWHAFNFFFISTYQSLILFCICLPIYYEPQTDLELSDLVSAFLYLTCFFIETVADQQQWNFQTEKYRKIRDGVKPGKNFLDTGLFRFSRHPNFFAEISIWWIFFSFTKSWNFSVVGPIMLNSLFHFSTEFTERLSLEKYPEYKEYQKTTSRLVPWFSNSKKLE